jgi:hypothetical protein
MHLAIQPLIVGQKIHNLCIQNRAKMNFYIKTIELSEIYSYIVEKFFIFNYLQC